MKNRNHEDELIRQAMSALGRRSHQAERLRLGDAEYRARMRELGRRGGEAARGKSGRKRSAPR